VVAYIDFERAARQASSVGTEIGFARICSSAG
jgi:hypothetical protein